MNDLKSKISTTVSEISGESKTMQLSLFRDIQTCIQVYHLTFRIVWIL